MGRRREEGEKEMFEIGRKVLFGYQIILATSPFRFLGAKKAKKRKKRKLHI